MHRRDQLGVLVARGHPPDPRSRRPGRRGHPEWLGSRGYTRCCVRCGEVRREHGDFAGRSEPLRDRSEPLCCDQLLLDPAFALHDAENVLDALLADDTNKAAEIRLEPKDEGGADTPVVTFTRHDRSLTTARLCRLAVREPCASQRRAGRYATTSCVPPKPGKQRRKPIISHRSYEARACSHERKS